jgi:hypothetical protein
MLKTISAKYRGKCKSTGNPIKVGDLIEFDTVTKCAYLINSTRSRELISDVFNISGREFYRNKSGRCIDAPCCGCCTI